MTTETVTYAPEVPIWARLHLARFLAGMEIRELAVKTGISRNTISNYESEDWDRKRNPAYIRLWALATGVSYEWLTGAVPPTGDGLNVIQRRNAPPTGFGRVVPFRPGSTARAA